MGMKKPDWKFNGWDLGTKEQSFSVCSRDGIGSIYFRDWNEIRKFVYDLQDAAATILGPEQHE